MSCTSGNATKLFRPRADNTVMKTKQIAFEILDVGLGWPIQLTQTGANLFSVSYGAQVKKELSYEQAAEELGACIMHGLACQGRIEND